MNYTKQAGPHYQRYGWEMVKGDAKCEDLANDVKYSSQRGEAKPLYGLITHYVDHNGIHHYHPNVEAHIDYDGTKFLREDFADIKGDGSIARIQKLSEKEGLLVKKKYHISMPMEAAILQLRWKYLIQKAVYIP